MVRSHSREPQLAGYQVETEHDSLRPNREWLGARPEDDSATLVEFGPRVVLELKSSADLGTVLKQSPLLLARTITSNVFVLQAPDAWTALDQAQFLSTLPEVLASHPVSRRAGA